MVSPHRDRELEEKRMNTRTLATDVEIPYLGFGT